MIQVSKGLKRLHLLHLPFAIRHHSCCRQGYTTLLSFSTSSNFLLSSAAVPFIFPLTALLPLRLRHPPPVQVNLSNNARSIVRCVPRYTASSSTAPPDAGKGGDHRSIAMAAAAAVAAGKMSGHSDHRRTDGSPILPRKCTHLIFIHLMLRASARGKRHGEGGWVGGWVGRLRGWLLRAKKKKL